MICTYPRLLLRVAAPASEPLTLAETKLYLRVDHTAEDTLMNNLITAAREAGYYRCELRVPLDAAPSP